MGAPDTLDELAQRRDREAQTDDHRTRMDYDALSDALADARRVVDDLAALGDAHLLVTAAELDFTVRRLRTLIGGAIVSVQDAGLR